MRNYKRKRGARPYLTDYTDEKMNNALMAVRSGVSFGDAAEQFDVPKTTLYRKFLKQNRKKPGGQTWLSEAFELAIVQLLRQLGEWKVPMTLMEMRILVKNYLDLAGVGGEKFGNNLPGRDWARGFLKRHRLSLRYATRIKFGRAKLSRDDLESYFSHLRESLDGVDPSQIYNFDETNFTDDPTRKKCIVRRGVNRHERVTPFSKQAFSVMFCGSATGTYLPPMIVYKAKHVYEAWACDGIKGAVYDATESGWFNMRTFERWFFEIFLKHVKDVDGPKVLIGDNLSSHFSPAVVASCIEHNIRFVTLVPNSTHLCQPLDVAVFRPMKVLWRAMLIVWRTESRSIGTIPKETFPRLLARVFAHVKGKNLVAGFKASGIVPLDSEKVLKQLTGTSSTMELGAKDMFDVLNEACLNLLRDYCGVGTTSGKVKARRGKKITPGKAIGSKCLAAGHEEVWLCRYCELQWKQDDNRWIVCDRCDHAFHLQCSGIQYRARDYYEVDIEGMDFFCEDCT